MPPLEKQDSRYTYADYADWPEDEAWELLDGVPYMMAPAPSQAHQEIVGELFGQLRDYLKGKSCKVFVAPFDVRLNAAEADDTVVQPDVLVVCDPKKLDGKSCNGAPDLVVEILSPATADRDRVFKFQAYLAAGVREYWIVDPETRTAQVCVLKGSFYGVTVHNRSERVNVSVLEDCVIDLGEVFGVS